MQLFSVYNQASGLITKIGACTEDMLEYQCGVGEGYVIGNYDPTTHFIKGGEAKELPPKVGSVNTFDPVAEVWVDNRTPEQVARELTLYKEKAIAEIVSLIRQIRSYFVTPLPGQEMIYLRKEQEAVAYLSDPEPDMGRYPLLSGEVGITAPTAEQLAQVWLNMSHQLVWMAGTLEGIRMRAGAEILACTTMEAVDQVKQGFLMELGLGNS